MGIMIELPGGLSAYYAEPSGYEPRHGAAPGGESTSESGTASDTGIRGALVVVHEIWGLVDHIKDVADRFAAEGYVVIAPDILGPTGVSPEVGSELQRLVFHADEKTRTEAQPLLREKLAPANAPEYAEWAVAALRTAVDYLDELPGVDGRIAVTGFCFGGGYSFALAAADRRIRAAVPFYGHPPASTSVATIGCPVLAFYGRTDERLMSSLPQLTATMADAGVLFTAETYEGVGHAFFNDTNTMTYDAAAAADAFARTLAFLRSTLAREGLSGPGVSGPAVSGPGVSGPAVSEPGVSSSGRSAHGAG